MSQLQDRKYDSIVEISPRVSPGNPRVSLLFPRNAFFVGERGRGGRGMGAWEKEEREEGGESEAVCERCDNIVSSLTTFIQK